VVRGYGFILPDEHLPDILLHVSCLRRGGFQTAYEGSRIICEVVRTPKGLQAARIRGMDNSTAIRPAQLPQRTHVFVFAQRLGKSGGEAVQSVARVWFSHARP
jgi:CspA family cold shock protein